MKITYNINFYYDENRIKYLLKIINESMKYKFRPDIYIHTNINFQLKKLIEYDGKLELIIHDLSKINHKKLTWLTKTYIKKFINDYDIFIYSEDDMLIYNESFNYWLQYKDICFSNKYNLGFLRIEFLDNKNIFLTDISSTELEPEFITLNNNKFLINKKSNYYACWIYDKNIMKKFIKSNYYNSQRIKLGNHHYDIRASQALGFHGKNMGYFKNTLIPINGIEKVNNLCYIHHMPNNYINKDTKYGKLKVNDLLI